MRCARLSISAPPFPLGDYYIAEVAGPEAIMTTIPELTGLHTYGICWMFHFCTAVPPLLSSALSDAWYLGPLVSAWVWPVRGASMKRHALPLVGEDK
jgi:hypothetical protein